METETEETWVPMTMMHRDILQKARESLVTDMDPEYILLKMAGTGVFTVGHEEEIKAGFTRQKRCETLLSILPRRSDRAYDIFKKALEKDDRHLARLLQAENEELSSELNRERKHSARLKSEASRNQTCSRCQSLGKEIKALKNGMETLQKEKDNMETKIRNLDKQNEDLKEQIKISSREKTEFEVQRKQIQQELEKGNQDLGEEINALKNRMATLQEEKDNRETKIRNLNMQNDELKTEIKLQQDRLDAQNRKNVKVGREKDNLTIEKSRLQQELKRLTKKLEKLVNAEPDPSLSRSPAEFNQLLMKCKELEEKISLLSKNPTQQDLDDERESHRKELVKLKSEGDEKRKTLEKEIKDRDTKIRALEQANAKLKTYEPPIVGTLKEQVENFTKLIGKLGSEKNEIESKWKQTRKQLREVEKKRKEVVQREQYLKEAVLQPSIFVPSKKDYYSPGVVHALNTLSSAKLVATRSSEGPGNARDIFDRKKIIICSGTKEEKDSWWCVDLGQDYLLAMTHYALRHGNKEGEKVLSNWKMEGSTDGIHFIEIKTFEKIDNPPRYRGSDEHAPGRWSVQHAPGKVGAFRYFRIFQTRSKSSSNYGIYLSGLELYGVLFKV